MPIVYPNAHLGSVSGTLSLTDPDFYSAAAQAGDILFISVDGDPERDGTGTDTRVTLYDTNGTTVLFSANSSGAGSASDPPGEAFAYRVPVTGTYYVKVELLASSGPNTYLLMVKRGAANSFTLDWRFRRTGGERSMFSRTKN